MLVRFVVIKFVKRVMFEDEIGVGQVVGCFKRGV